MIAPEFIHQLLEKVDIVDIIERYVPLKKRGQNYVACCPFHNEKTPSFTVTPTKQFFHCFGCGANGSAISFIMQHQGFGFVDAVEQLANIVNMPVPKTNLSYSRPPTRIQREKSRSLEGLLAEVAAFYQANLQDNPQALSYLKTRGLSDKTINDFNLGYAPDHQQWLSKIGHYDDRLWIDAGLVAISEENNEPYHRFRDRVMFPIRNQKGAIIGFGGRTIDAIRQPKYLNSPETALFKKGQELYGFYEARQAIRSNNRVLVVEGYMDVIALAQYGIGYAVATLGTATTPEHIRKLLQHADAVYFCFDGDEAGNKAAWRALENSLPIIKDGKAIHFLFLPPEHDPDSFIRAHSAEIFEQKLLHESLPLSGFMMRKLTQSMHLQTSEERAKLVRQTAPLLAELKSAPVLAHLMRDKLAELTGISVDELQSLLGQSSFSSGKFRRYQLPATSQRISHMPIAYRQILCLLMNPSWAEDVALPDAVEEISDELSCLAMLSGMILEHEQLPSTAYLIEKMRDTPYGNVMDNALKHMTVDRMDLLAGSSDEARQSFREGNQRMLRLLWGNTAFKKHINAIKDKPLEAISDAEKQLIVEFSKKQ